TLPPLTARAAGPTPAQRCLATKLDAAGREASGRLLCESHGLAGGPDAQCLARATQRRIDAFQDADARGGCLTTGDATSIGVVTSGLVDQLLAELAPGRPAASRCTTG